MDVCVRAFTNGGTTETQATLSLSPSSPNKNSNEFIPKEGLIIRSGSVFGKGTRPQTAEKTRVSYQGYL